MATQISEGNLVATYEDKFLSALTENHIYPGGVVGYEKDILV